MHALALVESPDHVCCRYRIRAFASYLDARGVALTIKALASSPWGRVRQFQAARRFDSVLLQRKLLPRWQVGLLRHHARRLVFDFDDAVLYRDSYDPRGPHCPRRSSRFQAIVRASDVVIAGNRFLASLAEQAGADPGKIRPIPTCVNPAPYDAVQPRRSGAEESVRLVWVGSSSTLQGLEASRSLWDRIGRALPELRFRIVCDRFPDLGALTVERVPWEARSEVEALRSADIGIGWVPDDLWSRGKCGLKVLQYQASGLPVVANPVGVHAEMVMPGRSGFLATTDDDWIEAIRRLSGEPSLRDELGRHARQDLGVRYAPDRWADALHAALSPESRVSLARAARGPVLPTPQSRNPRLGTHV